jgi:hypothetical protein
MVKTIRVSDDYHRWLSAHNRPGESMEETLRRVSRMPDPEDFRGVLTSDEAEAVEEAIERAEDRSASKRANLRTAFSPDSER